MAGSWNCQPGAQLGVPTDIPLFSTWLTWASPSVVPGLKDGASQETNTAAADPLRPSFISYVASLLPYSICQNRVRAPPRLCISKGGIVKKKLHLPLILFNLSDFEKMPVPLKINSCVCLVDSLPFSICVYFWHSFLSPLQMAYYHCWWVSLLLYKFFPWAHLDGSPMQAPYFVEAVFYSPTRKHFSYTHTRKGQPLSGSWVFGVRC